MDADRDPKSFKRLSIATKGAKVARFRITSEVRSHDLRVPHLHLASAHAA
jgi:hypothetical protein